MPRKASIAPFACAPLKEEILPATAPETPAAWQLPADFPREILNDAQQEAVEQWWNTWVDTMLHITRAALRGHTTAQSKHHGASAADLPTLQLHAVVLAHLLRLHPAAEKSLPKLAEEMQLPTRALYYARDTMLAHIRPALAGIQARAAAAASAAESIAAHPALHTADTVRGEGGVLYIPFSAGAGVATRFSAVLTLSRVPGIAAVREDFMPGTTRHAVRITLKH